jgi:carotenoid cleavage dioxygenase
MMRYEPDLGARVGILPRRGQGREIRWFTIQTCYVFHTLNAYEEGDEVVLRACRMAQFPAEIAGAAPAANAVPEPGPSLHEWHFNLRTGAVVERAISDIACEFPRFREDRMGQSHRYGYAGKADGAYQFDGLLKFDLTTGNAERHVHGGGRFGGEGVFVPRPDQRDEDAGWLMTFVHDQGENRGELVIVDAQDFRAAPVARIVMPARVPYGFHGIWVGDRQFSARS